MGQDPYTRTPTVHPYTVHCTPHTAHSTQHKATTDDRPIFSIFFSRFAPLLPSGPDKPQYRKHSCMGSGATHTSDQLLLVPLDPQPPYILFKENHFPVLIILSLDGIKSSEVHYSAVTTHCISLKSFYYTPQ